MPRDRDARFRRLLIELECAKMQQETLLAADFPLASAEFSAQFDALIADLRNWATEEAVINQVHVV